VKLEENDKLSLNMNFNIVDNINQAIG